MCYAILNVKYDDVVSDPAKDFQVQHLFDVDFPHEVMAESVIESLYADYESGDLPAEMVKMFDYPIVAMNIHDGSVSYWANEYDNGNIIPNTDDNPEADFIQWGNALRNATHVRSRREVADSLIGDPDAFKDESGEGPDNPFKSYEDVEAATKQFLALSKIEKGFKEALGKLTGVDPDSLTEPPSDSVPTPIKPLKVRGE